MNDYYVDLHIHIGRTESGKPVKISGSRDLTFYNIAHESATRKGIDMIGIIDCHAPSVQEEIMGYLHSGEMEELEGGGIRYRQSTIILGSEIEVRDEGCGPTHLLAYLPDLKSMQQFTKWMSRFMKNVELSSQRLYVTSRELQSEVISRGGFMIPAHIFTPYKSVYGSGSTRIADMLDLQGLTAVELGLSSDTYMASYLSELDDLAFVTNSDAHSLSKIGREYNQMRMLEPSYNELVKALNFEDGRSIIGNYGLNPQLGKYHRTFCAKCDAVLDETAISTSRCLNCGSPKIVRGVMDRILALADREIPIIMPHRPPYYNQIPLEFIPGLGKKKLEQLLGQFGTEMNVLHHVPIDDLTRVVGLEIAETILNARGGLLKVDVGGGGKYGRIQRR
ncbi:TIGR00375 family protein [Paenibacillus psychroresistens]|uniref:TIGR00375 family protein n=1 Tax=Paenibacillus psychroresistens TaxID=1778678 RepID=A0A6B8RHN6_9BACL|nr:endonuclease Q family protein [Paenibacillus psychroresistens]QGQ95971.1 TIGR00375 family protein [Paenibacillus psychroresistens]